MKITLLDAAILQSDFRFQRRRQPKNDSPFHLRAQFYPD